MSASLKIDINKLPVQRIIIGFLLLVIFLINVLSLKDKTLTADEPGFFAYGNQIIEGTPGRRSGQDSYMPLSVLNVIPWKFICLARLDKPLLNSSSAKKYLSERPEFYPVLAGRLTTVLFSLVLGFFVFRWTRKIYGVLPGFFSLFLYAFSPNIIAHSRLVTVDLFAACMVTLSVYFFWQFDQNGGWKNAFLCAFILGVSQLAKYTCLFLYPIFIIILLIKYSGRLYTLFAGRDIEALKYILIHVTKYVLLFIVINIAVINFGFRFDRTLMSLEQYEFKSNMFQSLQKIPVIKTIPIPLPYPYVDGIDWIKFYEKSRGPYSDSYLFGELRPQGFNGYFFYASFFKVPISIQIVILLSTLFYLKNRDQYHFMGNELFLFIPILFFTIYFNFFFRSQIGIRFFIVVFPLIHIFCGSIINKTIGMKKFRFAISMLCVYLIVSVLSYFPHYISYFNEFVWDRKQSYKILADSNLQWGQNKTYLKKYRLRHPDAVIHPSFVPTAGRVVVDVNKLALFEQDNYKWLTDNFKPVDHIAYTYLIFDIRPEALKAIEKNL